MGMNGKTFIRRLRTTALVAVGCILGFAYSADASGVTVRDPATIFMPRADTPAPTMANPPQPFTETPLYKPIILNASTNDKEAETIVRQLEKAMIDEIAGYKERLDVYAQFLPAKGLPEKTLLIAVFKSDRLCGIAGCQTYVYQRLTAGKGQWKTVFFDNINGAWLFKNDPEPFRFIVQALPEDPYTTLVLDKDRFKQVTQ